MWRSQQQMLMLSKYRGVVDAFKDYLKDTYVDIQEYPQFTKHANEALRLHIEKTVRKSAFLAAINHAKTLLQEYLNLFPFTEKYRKFIMNDIDVSLDYFVWANYDERFSMPLGPGYYDIRDISHHFKEAEHFLNESYNINIIKPLEEEYTYDDVFTVPREYVVGHIINQPYSLQYFETKSNFNEMIKR